MTYLPQILFAVLLFSGGFIFVKNVNKLRFNIGLGKKVSRNDKRKERWKNMIKIALGQSKMTKRPIAGLLHIIVYIGFIIINIEVLEIVIDGLSGTHRIFSPLGSFYDVLIGSFEILAFLVLLTVIVFWIRRNVIRIQRFVKSEMKGWPKMDANFILYFEIVLMALFLIMNGADYSIQQNFPNAEHYTQAGSFPVSSFLYSWFNELSLSNLILIERVAWWAHIVGILVFLNYLYYSKHLHILLAFPNTFFANLNPKGKFENNAQVTQEVQLMMNPDAPMNEESEDPEKFGASDVKDLNWVQLMNAYTCTECGRCTSECPANQTGKLLSPRKIMMDTRDRLEEVGEQLRKNPEAKVSEEKPLLGGYISQEEIWACTSCNACVEACPINIDPLSIIMSMRQYLVLEQSDAPTELNNMMNNIENNGAPWPYNQQDRLNWANE